MKNEHLNLDDCIELYYERADKCPRSIREHLNTCERCKQEFESFASTFDKANAYQVPQLKPNEHAELFEQIWSRHSSSVAKTKWSLNVFAYLRHPAFMFTLGTFFGILITILTANGSLDPAREASAEPNLRWETNGISQVISGKIVDKIYPELEDPTITVVDTPGSSGKRKKVLHGTMNDGSVQIVWNL